ncbi:phosphatidylethanolamine N-methyltransferase isoform X2 [Eptesicus fuscus]|uniref:phosphatidylethanolamine N-methyltransferase isoform X2 n=1 Tax=Eptesicus fuscus TaxID=29078 RepID=UPI0024041999|nr:phosphatidylethanolamine N-methyltransferase isoform X2 [Eptesicus fuscus]
MGPVLGQVVARSPRGPSRGGPQGRGSGAGSRAYEQVGGGARLLRRPGQHRLQADLCVMTRLLGYVDPWEPCFVAAVLAIVFNPLFWNVVARWEQRTRKLSGALGSPYVACYVLGGVILVLNALRSHWFTQAMRNQPRMDSLDTPTAYQAGLVLLGAGSVLVLSSFSALGFTGTFLGTPAPPACC